MFEAVVDDAMSVLRAAVDGVLGLDCEVVSASKLAGLISGLEIERRRLESVDARLIAGLAGQATPAQFGATSVPDLVGGLTRVSRGEARARAQRAVDLVERRTLSGEVVAAIQPCTAAALAAGEISGAHVDVITRYLGKLPASVGLEVWAVAEAFLVQAARHEDPGALRRSGELLLARLDPDGREPGQEQQERERCFGIGGRRGANEIYGRLTDEAKAVVQAMLDSLAAPRPAEDGIRDERSVGQRNHDALLEAMLRLLRCGTLPETGGVPVSVLVRASAEDLAAAAAHTDTDTTHAAPGETSPAEPSPAETSRADRAGAGTGEHGSGCAGSRGRGSGGRGSGGVAQSGHGDILSLDRILRHAGCEAEISTVVLSATGEVLDYGRTRRTASAAQRRALAARDGGCCFPSCTRPAAWSEAHHIRAWIRGGLTDLSNLCLLCAHHHRTFEAAGWSVAMIDGVPQWTPPAWLDPSRRPRRNTAHHLPEITFAI